MSEDRLEQYASRVEELWRKHAAARDDLEQQAQDGIARDLGGICPVVSPPDWGPVVLVEDRWRKWVDKAISRINLEFKAEAKQLAESFGMRWPE